MVLAISQLLKGFITILSSSKHESVYFLNRNNEERVWLLMALIVTAIKLEGNWRPYISQWKDKLASVLADRTPVTVPSKILQPPTGNCYT